MTEPATLTRQDTSGELRTLNEGAHKRHSLALLQKAGAKFHGLAHGGGGGVSDQNPDAHAHKNLHDVKNLRDAFSRFGYSDDDRVRIHDRVRIYQQVKRDMAAKLVDLRHQHYHMAAKEVQNRFDFIKHEYDSIYRGDERRRAVEEMAKLNKAMHIIREKHDSRIAAMREGMVRERAEKRHELHTLQQSQKKILEQHIKRLPRPKKRASTKMLAMMQAEEHLARSKQYDEAEHVKHLIAKLVPVERKKFNEDYQTTLRHMRDGLKDRQKFMRGRLEEHLDGQEWALNRRMEKEHMELHRRLRNNRVAMTHAHKLRSFLEPQRTAKPAHPKRKHYNQTDAYFRGQHQLHKTVGNRHAHLPSLCDLHDFNAPMPSGSYDMGVRGFVEGTQIEAKQGRGV
jgi:hypothetical protein